MRRGTFAVAVSVGIGVPLIAAAICLTQPGVRQWVGEFLAPIPTARRTTSKKTEPTVDETPTTVVITGPESSELRSFVGDAGTPPDRGPRTALFPRELPAVHDGYNRPQGLRRPELAARDDETVERALQYLATDAHGHGALVAAFQRSGRHRDEVDRILRAWKLPTELAAVAYVESAFLPTASSLDGAAGLWSLPPDVARAYGLALLPKYDERRDVVLSTEAAAHYLADLHERLGSWELALFAFAEGYARTIAVLQKHTTLEYWDLASDLPPDGTAYVAEVLAVATILGNPTRFGLDIVKPDDPAQTSDLEVPSDATFLILSRASGIGVERLRELNPEYLSDAVPSTNFPLIVHLPSGSLARAKEMLMPLMYSTGGTSVFDLARRTPGRDGGTFPDAAAAPGREGAEVSTTIAQHGSSKKAYYRVQDGDTLESLARRFGLPRDAIASDNALDPTAGLKPGQLLLIHSGGNSAAGSTP